MEIVPLRPLPPTRGSAAPRGTGRAPSAKAAAHPAAHATAAHADAVPTPQDVALLQQQAAFDQMMQIRAELQREANAMRDLAMEQIKRDDAVMNQWIKLI